MERQYWLGLGAFTALAGAVALAAPRGTTEARSAEHRAAVEQAQTSARLVRVVRAKRDANDDGALDSRFRRMVEKPTMVGMAVGIVEHGRITFLSGYGETLEGSGEKVTPETVFRWASTSKGVAATMVAKLAQQGKLSMDQPIAGLAPTLKLPNRLEQQATMTDVLSHRLGLYRNAYDNKLEEGQPASVLRSTLFELNAICPVGTCWSYQNVAYDAASEAVTKVTGEPYADVVQRQLFRPIGMTSATMTRAGLQSARSWARPHSVGRRPMEVNDIYYGVPAAAGVNSNIKDMTLWMLAQMGEMPLVLDRRLLDQVHSSLVATPNERGRMRKFLERLDKPTYGLGWRNYEYAGHRVIGHRGGVNGYRSLILFDPALKSGVVALWNSNTSQPGGLEFEVMDMIYRLPFRDWMDIDKGAATMVESAEDNASGDRR